MSDKESVDEKEVATEDVVNEENKIKGQKRKRPVPKATPSKKKVKSEEPPVSDKKDTTETEEDEEMHVGLLDRSLEVTGTRVRKQVDRLNINSPTVLESPVRRKNELLPGKGVKLGTSPKILAQLQNVKQSDMTLLHRLLFKRPGTAHEIKKNIREFSGFPFDKTDKEFESRKHMLEKNTVTDLKFICQILCLEKVGTKEGVIERILEFCLCPKPSIQPIAKKTKKKTKESKKKSNAKSDDEKAARSSPKKNITSNETVEDDSSSSSDEAENESSENENSPEPTPVKKATKKPVTPKPAKEAATPKANKKVPAAKANKEASESKSKKKTPKKSPKKAEIKVKLPPLNMAKKKLTPIESTESEGEEDKNSADTSVEKSIDDENSAEESSPPPKKSPSNTEKPTKVAQSPAKSPKSTASKSEPTNDELTDIIKEIINDANLEDMTMKNLCRQVYQKFPEYELEKTRKEFIRSKTKEILGSE